MQLSSIDICYLSVSHRWQDNRCARAKLYRPTNPSEHIILEYKFMQYLRIVISVLSEYRI